MSSEFSDESQKPRKLTTKDIKFHYAVGRRNRPTDAEYDNRPTQQELEDEFDDWLTGYFLAAFSAGVDAGVTVEKINQEYREAKTNDD